MYCFVEKGLSLDEMIREGPFCGIIIEYVKLKRMRCSFK